jgi:hypothetical protein
MGQIIPPKLFPFLPLLIEHLLVWIYKYASQMTADTLHVIRHFLHDLRVA